MQDMWYTISDSDVINKLNSSIDGISNEEAATRLSKYGFNKIDTKKEKSVIVRFFEQFKNITLIILIVAAIISGIIGVINGEGIIDTIIIFIVVFLNAIIGVFEEISAEKSVKSLEKLSVHVCRVKRKGEILVIPSTELVCGDIVLIESGDVVSADMRVISSNDLSVLESSLTGESNSISKCNCICNIDTPLAERTNMLYSSSLVTYGRGVAIVVATGMKTEIGKIASMLYDEKNQKTPLQEKLDNVGKKLGLISIIICIVLFAIGILSGTDIALMFMTAVSLGVAAIPEGLVAVSTLVLSIGVKKMVKKNVIIRRLYSVETLGSTSVICTDKTGTLTQNKMKVIKWFCNDQFNNEGSLEFLYLMENCLLCNDLERLNDGSFIGDPTEEALYEIAMSKIDNPNKILSMERIDEIPFDSERKLMSVVYKVNDKYIYFVKGAVGELVKLCDNYMFDSKIYNIDEYRDIILSKNDEMACDALRVLGFAIKITDKLLDKKSFEKNLTFIGLVGMMDPLREEVLYAIKKCWDAGIRTVMITGDQKITAIAIAKQLGILDNETQAISGVELDNMSDIDLIANIDKYSVYARVMPEHKLRIVEAWQKRGNVVAMTGDGINDSPALKRADIGCSMGLIGTEVAKEASDLILADDNFSTIVCAVEEGRRIFSNIVKVVHFLISSNVGEIVLIFVATLFSQFILQLIGITDIKSFEILLPIHILWVNLITDSIPAFALSFDEASPDIMKKKPNNNKSIFNKSMIYRIVYQGILIGITTLIAFVIGVNINDGNSIDRIKVGQTMAFATISLIELMHVFNVRDSKKSLFTNIFSNKILLFSTLISIIIVLLVLYLPSLRNIFSLSYLNISNLCIVVMLSFAPTIIIELFKLFKINSIR